MGWISWDGTDCYFCKTLVFQNWKLFCRIKMIFYTVIQKNIGMQSAIGNMLKNGLKNISDETARAYLEHLAGLGEVKVGGEVMTGSALMRDYDDFAKVEFKEAGKAIAKVGKKKGEGAVDKPKRAKSAYLLFCEDMRPQLQGEGLKFTEVAKRLGELWGDEPTKEKWNAVAAKLKGDGAPADAKVVQGKPVKVATAVKAAGAKAKAGFTEVAVKMVGKAGGKAKVLEVGDTQVKFATPAAEKFARVNLDEADLAGAAGFAKGPGGAFRLVDLKKVLEDIETCKVVEEEDEEEEEVEEDEEEVEEDEEEVEEEDEEEEGADSIGYDCKVKFGGEWRCGVVAKYNKKKATHKIDFVEDEDGGYEGYGKTLEFNIKEYKKGGMFEWDE